MHKAPLAALALFGAAYASSTADESWDDSLSSCQDYASKFDNTCSSATALSSMTSASVTCSNNYGVCAGTESNGSCTWNRKLCVTCRSDQGTVKIRVQTNGLPNHCYKSPQTAPAEQTVDFEVNWLSAASQNSASSPTTQSALNALMCDSLSIAKRGNIPSSAGFTIQDGSDSKTAFGVATSGVLLFSALSAENVDPFYPAVYADVTNPDDVVEKVDWCLAHPQAAGVFHYHSASTCVADKATYQSKTGAMTDDVKTVMEQAWAAIPYRSAFGIAKDGRPILSPFHGNGKAYDACEVDVCNGLEINGHYMYASTFFHPYMVGCYGKGSAPELYQECSSNPRLCGVLLGTIGAVTNSVSLAVAGASALYMTLF